MQKAKVVLAKYPIDLENGLNQIIANEGSITDMSLAVDSRGNLVAVVLVDSATTVQVSDMKVSRPLPEATLPRIKK